MDNRAKIWSMIYSLIDERNQESICLFEGVKKYEDEVADIIDKVEELAATIEKKIEGEPSTSGFNEKNKDLKESSREEEE